jgi:hypothetical protein
MRQEKNKMSNKNEFSHNRTFLSNESNVEDMNMEEDFIKKLQIPEEEVELIDKFMSCFVLATDSGSKVDQIDIKMALKALPRYVDEANVFKMEQYNFQTTKTSLISFTNDDQDELFKYYDSRNKSRLNKLNDKASLTEKKTHNLISLGQKS